MQQLDLFAPGSRLSSAVEAAKVAYDAGLNPNTKRSDDQNIRGFYTWVQEFGLPLKANEPIPTDILVLHIGWMLQQNYARTSIQRRKDALRKLCRTRGWPDPADCQEFRQIMKGVNDLTNPPQSMEPLLPEHVVAALQRGSFLPREKAALLVGVVAGLRVNNLISRTWADVTFDEKGVRLWVKNSKTDKACEGRYAHVPAVGGEFCPVAALKALPRIGSMFPIFGVKMTEWVYRDLVKRAAVLAGLDPKNYSAHSMRSGLAVSAYEAGTPLPDIQFALWHHNPATTIGYLRKYLVAKNKAHQAAAQSLSSK